jgi:DNA-binding PadR family transcriptional regulator
MSRVTSRAAQDGGLRLNATAAALLGLLFEHDMTGWDLIEAAQERIGEFWTLTPSQVYRELAAMAERGLVEAGPRGPRERRPFQVTPAGRAAFAEWLHGTPGEDQVRIPLLLTIAFAEHLSEEHLDAIIAERRAVHEERAGRYRAARQLLDDLGETASARRATLEFGLRHEQAVLDWFDVLPGLLPARRS